MRINPRGRAGFFHQIGKSRKNQKVTVEDSSLSKGGGTTRDRELFVCCAEKQLARLRSLTGARQNSSLPHECGVPQPMERRIHAAAQHCRRNLSLVRR
jgi:hypothetical protein